MVTAEAVPRAYSERLLGSGGYDYFKIYALRERPYPTPLRGGAFRILNAIAAAPEGVLPRWSCR